VYVRNGTFVYNGHIIVLLHIDAPDYEQF